MASFETAADIPWIRVVIIKLNHKDSLQIYFKLSIT